MHEEKKFLKFRTNHFFRHDFLNIVQFRQGQDRRFKMRTFLETGFSRVWSKQKILVGVGGGWRRKSGQAELHGDSTQLYCLHHTPIQYTFCVRNLKRLSLFSTLCEFRLIPYSSIHDVHGLLNPNHIKVTILNR